MLNIQIEQIVKRDKVDKGDTHHKAELIIEDGVQVVLHHLEEILVSQHV